jgi:hypothetical protein
LVRLSDIRSGTCSFYALGGQLFDQPAELGLGPGNNADPVPCLAQRERRGSADPFGGSGNEGGVWHGVNGKR